jgi:hypothetical protein
MRKIDVYKTPVVVRAGETFEWENKSGNTVTVSSSTWPLTQSSYQVVAATSQNATVNTNASAGSSSGFQSSPPPSPPTTQNMIVAGWHGEVCSDVTVLPNQYILWHNGNSSSVTIKPQSGTTWPWSNSSFSVSPGGDLVVQVPTGAQEGSYPIVVTLANGSNPCLGSKATGNPTIMIGGNLP